MNLRDYWMLPVTEQNEMIKQDQMLVESMRPASVPKPGGYTCKCRLADPNYCYDDTHDVEVQDGMNGTCECSCHSDCGGEW